MKTCTSCGLEKSLDCFYTDKKKKVSRCKACNLLAKKEYYQKNKKVILEKCAASYLENKEYRFKYNLQYKYGITLEQRDAMFEEQDHKCKICETPVALSSDDRFKVGFIDHCHTTGKIRGILCHHCNSMLGYSRDSVKNLAKAIEYLSDD